MKTSTASKSIASLFIIFFLAMLGGCNPATQNHRAVYLLVDTSGTYTQELVRAQAIVHYLLATLDSGDALAVARIDSGSFSEKDIIHRVTFDHRPSVANNQKRVFKQAMDDFVDSVTAGSRNTDITGGLLQATEFLEETGATEKYVLIFSDLEEDLAANQIRNFPLPLDDIHVIALNVTKLRSDNIDPRDYLQRLEGWQERVVNGGGDFRVVNDLERVNQLITSR